MSVPATRGVSGRDPDERRFHLERQHFTCHEPGCGEYHDGVHEIDGERHVSFRCLKHTRQRLAARARRRKQYTEEVELYARETGDQRATEFLEFLAEMQAGDRWLLDQRWRRWNGSNGGAQAFKDWRDINRDRLDHLGELRHGKKETTLEEMF